MRSDFHKILRRKFCQYYTKEIFTQYKGTKYSTTLRLDSKLTVEQFCSEILKDREFHKLQRRNRIEYVWKNNYLLKDDNILPLALNVKEDSPIHILEDSYTKDGLKERNLKIPVFSPMFQMGLNATPHIASKILDGSMEKEVEAAKAKRLALIKEAALKLKNRSFEQLKKDLKEYNKKDDAESIDNFKRLKREMQKIVSYVDNNPGDNETFEPLTKEQNEFNLPLDILDPLIAKGTFRKNRSALQHVLDQIFTYFSLSQNDEHPLEIELNGMVRPYNYEAKEVSILLTNRKTGKIFPVTMADNTSRNEAVDIKQLMYHKSVQNLHTLKQVSRSMRNEANRCHFGIVTNLVHWNFTLFERSDKLLEKEDESNLHISRTFTVGYNREKGTLNYHQLNDCLRIFKHLLKSSDEEIINIKTKTDERFREAANVGRKVKI